MLMKVIIHAHYGNPEVLQVATLERPVPQKNEVLVRVKAAGLDYGQWHLMSGKPYAMRLATAGGQGCADDHEPSVCVPLVWPRPPGQKRMVTQIR